MKILILSDAFPPENNAGAEQMSFRLAREYMKAGHQVMVLTTTRNKDMIGDNDFQGLRVTRFFSKFAHRGQAYQSLYNPGAIRFLKEYLRNKDFDIIHAHNIHLCFSYYSLKVIRGLKIRALITLHDCMAVCYKKFDCFYDSEDLDNPPRVDYEIHPFECFRCQKKRYFFLRNILIRHLLNKYTNKIITVSGELKKLIEANGIRVDETIYNGVDTTGFDISKQKIQNFRERFFLENKKIVLFGGRMNADKGSSQLLNAMELVCKKEPRAWLLILADKENEYVRNLVNQANKKEINILVTGWLRGDDLLAAYYSCDLVATPSVYLDAFGLMSIEAMACKKPVITSCFSGGKEIVIHGKSGYIVNPFNVDDFSNKILNIFENDRMALEMGEYGYKVVEEKFKLEDIAKRYLEIIE